jgi:integrase
MDPFEAPIPVIAEFLFSLHEMGRETATIRGYRTAISDTLKHRGRDVGSNSYLSDLLSSLHRERPRSVNRMPTWNLALVLRSLTREPYEPLAKASDKFLTLKTVFLLSLATGKRVSEIHALDINSIRWTESRAEVFLSPNVRFLAKTQRSEQAQKQLEVIHLRALAPTLQQDMTEDRSLCPVRALRYYISRTKEHRRSQAHLFVSYVANHKEVGKNTISLWIRRVIKKAYENHSDEDRVILGLRAHDLRGFSASCAFFNNVPLVEVLNACTWKRHSTFSEFYLRNMATQADDLYQLGPLVVAQHQI